MRERNDVHGDEEMLEILNKRKEDPDAWKDLREDLHKVKRSQSGINQTSQDFRKKWQP